ncbi:hypothetical protein L1049_022463 [Liquidambar formosana]|uniref:Uncharacterized protein n=1 Tax=Liquidambar formosana TaxID=63359 RepID=A0AAP0RCG7_LIQFO
METPPQPPSQPNKGLLAQRYKPVWRLLLISNLALGAYIFSRARKKDTGIEDGKATPEVSSPPIVNTPIADTRTPVPEVPSLPPPIIEPVKLHGSIPADQQLELFNWILGERGKIEPKDPEEKKRIDEEKAILEQYIREKSIPNL